MSDTPHVSWRYVKDFVLDVLNRANPYIIEKFAEDGIIVAKNFLLKHPKYFHKLEYENWKGTIHKMNCIYIVFETCKVK